MSETIESLSIATLRSLCIDMINKANSGHPGMALGSAPILYTLFTKHLVANPKDPTWFNRDRFILESGHASSLLYATLHLCGYDISLDDLKNFRQLGSITPGHPEVGVTPGVDVSTGPLGQGLSNAVGMALAEQMVNKNYPSGNMICDHYTYCLCGDGSLEEGISQEAISFAGNNQLNKLIVFYDCNKITIDGSTDITFTDDTRKRFEACNWNVLEVADGNNVGAIDAAIVEARKSKDQPTLIIVHTVIGFGSKNQGTSKVHGAPLGIEDGNYAKKEVYGFDHAEFFVPEEVRSHFNDVFLTRCVAKYDNYQSQFVVYLTTHDMEAKRFLKLKDGDVSSYLPDVDPDFETKPLATRKSSNKALNQLSLSIPNLFGGAADLSSSVMTKLDNGKDFSPTCKEGHNINFGIRELAMAGIQNGMLLHGGVRTYCGGFLSFADYMKPGIRMAAISNLPAIYVFSHDSIAVGEDGPTHQPIEQVCMLRCIPNVHVIRPADDRETFAAWKLALLSRKTPTALILTRQNVNQLNSSVEGVFKGAYVISKASKEASYVIIATGSEVSLAIDAQNELERDNIFVDVVSMPSQEIFLEQNEQYQHSVISLPREKCISLEMLTSFGWDRFAKYHISIDTFGKSGKASDVISHFGFTKENVVNFVKGLK